MYTIKVNDDNSLLHTVKERIMQRSNLVNKLRFLVPVTYNDYDMREFQCAMEYRLPISGDYVVKILTPDSELYTNEGYEDCIQYYFPADTNITKEQGDVSLKLKFTKLDMDEEGKTLEYVREIAATTLPIVPVENWAQYIPNSNLDELAQVLLSAQALAQQNAEIAAQLQESKADNIKVDSDSQEMYLTANGEKIGDSIDLDTFGSEVATANTSGLVKIVI